MANLRKSPLTGHLLKSPGDAADHLAKTNIIECPYCEEEQGPVTIDITFSGIVACTACTACYGSDYYKITNSDTINVLLTLTNTAPCVYEVSDRPGTALEISQYRDDICTDFVQAVSFPQRHVNLALQANGDLEITYWYQTDGVASVIMFFEVEVANGVDPPCSVFDGVQNNDFTACCETSGLMDPWPSFGHSGAATHEAIYC